MNVDGFRADLELIPSTLLDLAGELDNQLPVHLHERTLILGMGSSAYAASTVARAARASGQVVWSELASAANLPEPAPDLTVIAVSATGSSAELLHAVQPYRDGLIAITNDTAGELAGQASIVLPMHAGVETGGVACRTYRHSLAVLLQIMASNGIAVPDVVELVRAAARAAEHLLVATWLDDAADLLAPTGPSALLATLAPVERFGSAAQSALMVREGPRLPAYACETGDWSHVDVYLTKTMDYRALLYARSRWDQPALDWLRERNSRVVAVGAPTTNAALTIRYPRDDDMWVANLSEVLVAELLAHRWWATG